jgi:dTMP kinase
MTADADPVASRAYGKFITFEGGEGAGKSTQLRLLAERLATKAIETVATREPGGSPQAEKLRDILLSGKAEPLGPMGEAILFTAARIDHLDSVISPALKRGAWVLCDRFADSMRAYQGARGGLDPRVIALLERVALVDVKPDLTIILDLPPQEGLERASKRNGAGGKLDRFEREDIGFHEDLRRIFLNIAASEPGRCHVVNAQAPKAEVSQTIWRIVEERLFPETKTAPDAKGATPKGATQ